MSTDAIPNPGEINVLKTARGKVTNIRLGKHKAAIAIGRDVLKRAGLEEGTPLLAQLMSDGSLVLRAVKPQSPPTTSDPDAEFADALEEANRRFGNAFRRLAE